MRSEVLACGLTVEGQLGIRTSEPNISLPERIFGAWSDCDDTKIDAIACGENHTLFLTNKGHVYSVGGNTDGQLGRGRRGDGTFAIHSVSLPNGAFIIQIGAGRAHSVAVADDGRVFTWGSNDHGQLGMPSVFQWMETPKRLHSLNEVVQVACGTDHCVALTASGNVYVWGEQADGKCVHEPYEMDGFVGLPIVRVIAGSRHCVAISASGSVYTWGHNDYGQLGIDSLKPQLKIVHVEQMDGLGVVDGAAGDRHTVLLTHNGRLFTFGCDSIGQCGFDKKIEKRTNPTAVAELIGTSVKRVAAGRCHTIAISDGNIYAFGLNSSGQLGNGGYRSLAIPRRNDDIENVTAVFCGWDQTFIIRNSKPQEAIVAAPSCPLKKPRTATKELIDEALACGDKLMVIELIESVFSSLNCINASFLYDDDRRYHVSSERSHGVNLDDAMEAFISIGESSSAEQYMGLINDMLLVALEVDSAKFVGVECLRVFLVMPWMRAFSDNLSLEKIEKLHTPFIRSMCAIDMKLGRALERWWSKLPMRHFRRMVQVMRLAVRQFVIEKKSPTTCHQYLHVLCRLNDINKRLHIVPVETFYIDEINDCCDVKVDYFYKVTSGETNEAMKYWSAFPFLLNAMAKASLLHVEAVLMQQQQLRSAQIQTIFGTFFTEVPFLELHVRREFIVSDTMNTLASINPRDLRKPLKVKIHGEEADDAGGVRKEFFLIVMQKILQPDYGMFVEDETSHLVWFSALSDDFCDKEQFRQLGRLCGLAVYNRILVPFPFPLALYKMLLGVKPTLDDLLELSPVEAKCLQSLLDYEGDDVEEVFCLNFSMSMNVLGDTRTIELMEGGDEVAVTNENRGEYVELYVKKRLEQGPDNQIQEQAANFCRGFRDAVPERMLELFQPRELMEIIVGNENYDWNQFREQVTYMGVYHARHPAVLAFWTAFFKLDESQKKKFLQFLTGSTRLPLSGMSELQVKFQPTASEILPTAHTCFNLLDLPNIEDADEMLRRLLISIEHTEGFTLV